MEYLPYTPNLFLLGICLGDPVTDREYFIGYL